MNRFDFFLQVDVLRRESGLFLLHQYALGDVDKHRTRVGAARIGLGPPLNPDRLPVVFAAKFQDDATGVGSPVN